MRILFAIVSMVGLVLGMSVILAQEKKEQNDPEQNTSGQTLSALIKLNKKIENITFVGVTGEKKTIEELVNYISKILNFSGPFEHVPAPYGSVSRRCPDITKASNVLGYKPHHDWKEGVRVTTNWYKEYIINNGNIFE